MNALFISIGVNKEDIILLAAILKRIGFRRGASFLRGSIQIAIKQTRGFIFRGTHPDIFYYFFIKFIKIPVILLGSLSGNFARGYPQLNPNLINLSL